jgi:tetratricopeptide (TPR) repeat protein
MKKLFIVILFSFYSHSIAQVDSILKNIKNEPDTTKIRILNDLCWKNRSSDPRVSLQYGLEALKIGHQIESKVHQALSSNYIGVVYRNLGEYNQALRYYFDALKLSKEVADSAQVAYSYNNIGGIYRLTGDYESALTNIFNALGIFDRLKDKTGTAFCTINIAIIYRKEKNYPKAIEYLNYTLKIREELGDEQGRALTLNQLAEVYFEQDRYYSAYGTETRTPGYNLFNLGLGTDMVHDGKPLCSLYISLNNLTDKAYQSHLSRLKYTPENFATGRTGIYNMGRNLSFKLLFPIHIH